jgi:hypothetical protein
VHTPTETMTTHTQATTTYELLRLRRRSISTITAADVHPNASNSLTFSSGPDPSLSSSTLQGIERIRPNVRIKGSAKFEQMGRRSGQPYVAKTHLTALLGVMP